MTFATTVGLGAVAGLTILGGLPIARLGRPRSSVTAGLMAASVGILIFILVDVLKNATGTVETQVEADRRTGLMDGAILVIGLAVGLFSLLAAERFTRRARPRSGPGAMALETVHPAEPVRRPARTVALSIAVGIGLHNFSEGLAIGQSAHVPGERLFWLLVIGFGLHNMTEGFGIGGPLIGERPSWRFLGLCGLIGGGPTILGSVLGFSFTSPTVSIACFALAAGAILYVIGELQHAGRRLGNHGASMVGLFTGFSIAYATDLFLHIAGA